MMFSVSSLFMLFTATGMATFIEVVNLFVGSHDAPCSSGIVYILTSTGVYFVYVSLECVRMKVTITDPRHYYVPTLQPHLTNVIAVYRAQARCML